MRNLSQIILILIFIGCATTEENKMQRTITGYVELDAYIKGLVTGTPDGTYKGFRRDYKWDCYGLREYGNGDTYSGDWSTTGFFDDPIRSGKGVLIKNDGSVISGEWQEDVIFNEFYISANELRTMANNCAREFSKITKYWTPVEDFKASVKQEAAFWGGATETVITAALVTTVVVGAIATSPAGQAAIANQEAKNQKAREQAIYNKGKRDGERRARKSIKKEPRLPQP